MEWASWHFWGPGLSLLAGSAYFGGGNAAWRREALEGLGIEAPLLVVSHRPLLPRLAQRLAGVLAPFPTAGGLVLELDAWAPQGARLT